ncbi:MAG TPA: glucokinase [Candidatus Acidoferrales bacterium]|nr:glucokinase [Candidatus Acidoferrales bacterium]
MILAGDVGGTKCNLALFSEEGKRLRPVFELRFSSKDYPQFDDVVADFLRQTAGHCASEKISAAGFGVAGPVMGSRVKTTNLPWIVDAASLAKEIGVTRVVLLNDLAATAHSLAHLEAADQCVLNAGIPQEGANKALIAAGTGLGESILFWDGTRYRVMSTEGGHADFAPRTEREIELLRFLKKRAANVSRELVLSGRGFRSVHEFLNPAAKHSSFETPDADPAPEITRNALEGSCPVCVETLAMWIEMYGAEAGNLALQSLALAGMYVAGGIAVRVLPKLKEGAFFRAFCDKEKFRSVLERIPIIVVLNENAPLIGAAYEALAAAP